ncbi:MAG: hypothetical protein ABIG10_02560 [bacterium]
MKIKIDFKKALLLSGILIMAVIIGWLMYKMFMQKPEQLYLPTDLGQTDTSGLGFPSAGEGTGQIIDDLGIDRLEPDEFTGPVTQEQAIKLLQETAQRDNKIISLTEHWAINASLSEDGSSVRYYNADDGKFYRIMPDGKAVELSDRKFHQVQEVTWSPAQDKAVLKYPDDTKIIYDFEAGKQVTLPKHWHEFDWAPAGDQLIFKSIGLDPDNRWLAIVNSDGSGSHTIEKIGNNADKIITSWSPNNQVIAMMTEGLDMDRKTVYFIGMHGENFRSTITEGRGFVHKWSPQGDKIVYSVYSSMNDYKPMLWRVDAQGDNIGANRLPLELETWADKCVFSSNSELYCAVPRELETGAGLFPNLGDRTSDDLYHIDLATGTKTYLSNAGYYNMTNLIITNDQKYLYFTDKITGRLHKIEL